MSAPTPGETSFGPNAWLVDDMYEQYRQDPTSVSESWREFFLNYRPGGANLARPATPEVRSAPEEAFTEDAAETTAGESVRDAAPAAPPVSAPDRAAAAEKAPVPKAPAEPSS